MKMADVLRDIADLIDQKMGSNDSEQQNRLEPVQVEKPQDEEQPKMVPPLQAKLEILKKSEGLPSVYDGEGSSDEIALMKKRAGISTAQKEASEDNDITG
jgi:hypothetical protein